MILDLDFSFKDLAGNPIIDGDKPAYAYKIFSELLFRDGFADGSEPIKSKQIAEKLYTDKQVDIDLTDLDKIEKMITETKNLVNFVKADLLLAAKKARD